MKIIEQHHSGSGDNVQNKILNVIKSLAPDDLRVPMEMVFESLRKKDLTTAKIQLDMLKATTKSDPESSALVDVISIYGGLVDAKDHDTAWGTVSNIAATTQIPMVKDVCLAALLRLSHKTDQEEPAKQHYLSELAPGQYATEVYLSQYADEACLEDAASKFVIPEPVLTGVVVGSLRLELTALATSMAQRLSRTYPSYNAKVLEVLASAYELNPRVAQKHLWLCPPEVKQEVDRLAEKVVELIDISNGVDTRLYNMACPIFETYRGISPIALFNTLKNNLPHWESAHTATATTIKAIAGDDEGISQRQRDILAAKDDPQLRATWCRNFLSATSCRLEDVIPFFRLANTAEVSEWLSKDSPLDDATEMEKSFVNLLGCSFRELDNDSDLHQKNQLSQLVDDFWDAWEGELTNIAPERVFDLAENLVNSDLAHKALRFTSRLIPDQKLWPSPFVLTHLKCLLEAQQYKTFDDVIARVAGSEKSLTILSYQSLRAEKLGDIEAAIRISDQIVAQSPEIPYSWLRGCQLRARYQTEDQQIEFHDQVPDGLLKKHSHEAVSILYFFAMAGNFKRVEPRWVEWFIEDPHALAVEMVNFYFGLTVSSNKKCEFEVSATLEQCVAAVQFEQDGDTVIKLIVDGHQVFNEYTLKSSSQLAELLNNLAVGETGSLGMVNYKLVERLPPYVACLRIALRLRHIHNDGSDCFAMLSMPSDNEQIIPFLEEKLGQSQGTGKRKQLNKADNIPLYIRGHFLCPDNAFKGALNCWTDAGVPKTTLFDQGNEFPDAVVLDAYGIGYLAVTDLAQSMLDIGVKLVLPAATKEALSRWVEEISDQNFMLMGVTEKGKLFRTTAKDIQARDGHSLRALQLILDNASIAHPVLHDAALEIYSIKNGIDSTVYDAMQLSIANDIAWLCMDGAFAALHKSNQYEIANSQAIIARAMAASNQFDFERKRHGLLLYSLGALPLPVTYAEIHHLAAHPNALAGFILFKMIQNHGNQIFVGEEKPLFLLDVIQLHLNSMYHSGKSQAATRPLYTPLMDYTEHVFNHGIRLFLGAYGDGSIERRLAMALNHMGASCGIYHRFLEFVVGHFLNFAQGHFMDANALRVNLQSLVSHQENQS
ncbi:GapS6b family protein [Stutzerimonas stutzeri]|uniref:GapS6b family protein n=1 Tax=Stutzerimonas stutzeri group TaxID=136846 RepID=UPI0019099A02|nr:hypothetical protein [Stutzerimonas frequens]MBK3760496.1 hypothetical protein [Stutzerimonas frequens]